MKEKNDLLKMKYMIYIRNKIRKTHVDIPVEVVTKKKGKKK